MLGQEGLLFLVLAAIGAVVFVNGWTDAPCAIAACVSSGAMSLRRAAAMAAVCNFVGVGLSMVITPAVTATVSGMVRLPESGRLSLAVLLCAMIVTALWAVAAWRFGIPTSESHALLAGLSGAAMAYGGAEAVVAYAWLRVAMGLVLSLVGGMLAGFLTFVLTERATTGRDERGMRHALVAGAAAMSLMHGAQDGQKFLGLWLLAWGLSGKNAVISGEAVAICALLMGAGTLVGGGRIIRTLGEKLVRSGYREGIAADIGAALCLLLLTLGGLPVSTTHTKTAAFMGTGLAKGKGGADSSTAVSLIIAWLLTFPVCFLLSFLAMRMLLLF